MIGGTEEMRVGGPRDPHPQEVTELHRLGNDGSFSHTVSLSSRGGGLGFLENLEKGLVPPGSIPRLKQALAVVVNLRRRGSDGKNRASVHVKSSTPARPRSEL